MKNASALMKEISEAVADWDVESLVAEAQSTSSLRGSLYLAVNPSMEGLMKIGKTTRSPKERVLELSAATGIPTPFFLVFDVEVNDCSIAEGFVHDRLDSLGHRVSQNREFFRAPTAVAIRIMLEAEERFSE